MSRCGVRRVWCLGSYRHDQVRPRIQGVSRQPPTGAELRRPRDPPGEFVFLVGASGSGKSSFLRLVLKEDRPTQGTIHVLGQQLNQLSSRKVPYYRRSLGVVFQDFRLLPNKSVFDNVAFTLQVIGKSRGFIQEAVPDVLNMVGLKGKEQRLPHEPLRRRAAARRDRARRGQQARRAPRGRADRQPGPADERGHHAGARADQRQRHDGDHGHARLRHRRPDAEARHRAPSAARSSATSLGGQYQTSAIDLPRTAENAVGVNPEHPPVAAPTPVFVPAAPLPHPCARPRPPLPPPRRSGASRRVATSSAAPTRRRAPRRRRPARPRPPRPRARPRRRRRPLRRPPPPPPPRPRSLRRPPRHRSPRPQGAPRDAGARRAPRPRRVARPRVDDAPPRPRRRTDVHALCLRGGGPRGSAARVRRGAVLLRRAHRVPSRRRRARLPSGRPRPRGGRPSRDRAAGDRASRRRDRAPTRGGAGAVPSRPRGARTRRRARAGVRSGRRRAAVRLDAAGAQPPQRRGSGTRRTQHRIHPPPGRRGRA
ncbi:ATP-binding cassette domain-containing protein [Clavibacter tessellarius]